MLQEGIPIEVVEVPHTIPETIKLMVMVTRASRVDFEGDKGDSIHRLDSMEISSIRVGFVGRDFVDGECLGCLTYQNWELDSVSRLIGRSYYASNYVSLYSANYVNLNPRLLTAFLAIFAVKPARGSVGKRGVKPLSINLFPSPLKERGIKGVRLVNTLKMI
jgi:hypothetical protein